MNNKPATKELAEYLAKQAGIESTVMIEKWIESRFIEKETEEDNKA